MIVSYVTTVDIPNLLFNEYELTDNEENIIDILLKDRISGKPIQYIVGNVKFFDLEIKVGQGVLIPRPETEYMVECAIKAMKEIGKNNHSELSILDLCTGSGCIALALGSYFKNSLVIGTDISMTAISYANINKDACKLKNVSFLSGDLFSPLYSIEFDLIISNPPYVPTSEIENLQTEIKDYEPFIALDGGKDGMEFYRKIFNKSDKYLKKDGLLILEIGFGQSDELSKLALKKGYKNPYFLKDYSGIKRVLITGVN